MPALCTKHYCDTKHVNRYCDRVYQCKSDRNLYGHVEAAPDVSQSNFFVELLLYMLEELVATSCARCSSCSYWRTSIILMVINEKFF